MADRPLPNPQIERVRVAAVHALRVREFVARALRRRMPIPVRSKPWNGHALEKVLLWRVPCCVHGQKAQSIVV
jgi:hypothetical protein